MTIYKPPLFISLFNLKNIYLFIYLLACLLSTYSDPRDTVKSDKNSFPHGAQSPVGGEIE